MCFQFLNPYTKQLLWLSCVLWKWIVTRNNFQYTAASKAWFPLEDMKKKLFRFNICMTTRWNNHNKEYQNRVYAKKDFFLASKVE